MIHLRLLLGTRPANVLRRVLIAGASACTGFLLLCALEHAVRHPGHTPSSVARLVWCLVPLAAVMHLSAAVSRREAGARPAGVAGAGFGPGRAAVTAAAATAVACLAGSALAFGLFLRLRVRGPFALPSPAVATLLAATPVLAAVAAAAALRSRDRRRGLGSGLPWGLACVAAGLGVELYATRWARPHAGVLLPLPGGFGQITPPMLLGRALTWTGLVLAGPGLVRWCGRALSSFRPGVLRLLAGRALTADACRVGHPLGVLCAVASAAVAAAARYEADRAGASGRPPGPLTAAGAALVVTAALAAAVTAAAEAGRARGEVKRSLREIGASRALLRRAGALRTLTSVAALAAVTWAVTELAAIACGGLGR